MKAFVTGFNHLSGTSKKTGNEYNFYSLELLSKRIPDIIKDSWQRTERVYNFPFHCRPPYLRISFFASFTTPKAKVKPTPIRSRG